MFQLTQEQMQIQETARRVANEVFKDRAAEITGKSDDLVVAGVIRAGF